MSCYDCKAKQIQCRWGSVESYSCVISAAPGEGVAGGARVRGPTHVVLVLLINALTLYYAKALANMFCPSDDPHYSNAI